MLSLLQNKIFKSSNFLSLAGNGIQAFFGLLGFLIMVRLLDKHVYGAWVIFITSTALLDMLRYGLSGMSAIHFISKSEASEKVSYGKASYQIGLLSTIAFGLLFYFVLFLFATPLKASYYLPVLLYYPALALANLPRLQAESLLQGKIDFGRLLVLRGMKAILNFTLVVGYLFFFEARLPHLIIATIAAEGLVSLFVVATGWAGRLDIFHLQKQKIRQLLQFGKYSTASYVGSNLLRSSDAILLSLSSVMGASAIAIYAIPLKFVELIEIPLRSLSAAAFPKLSAACQVSRSAFDRLFFQYLSYSVLFLLPAIFVLLFFSAPLLSLIGGSEYAESMALQQRILYIITFYILLLPFDRYSGMALFALNRPRNNFLKICIMLIANILIDLLAVFVFQSLELVAVGTVLFTFLGITLGWRWTFEGSNYKFSHFSFKKLFTPNNLQGS